MRTGKNLITHIRQLTGRNDTKYSAGGREKRRVRPVPSLPKLKFLGEENAAPTRKGAKSRC